MRWSATRTPDDRLDLLGRPVDDAVMLELLEPTRPHRHRVVCLLQAGGRACEPRRGPRPPVSADRLDLIYPIVNELNLIDSVVNVRDVNLIDSVVNS